MEHSTKETITNACQQKIAIVIKQQDFFSRSSDAMYSYEVRENGDITRTNYKIANINCDCFGCDYPTMESDGSEILGNCNDLSFLAQ